MRFVHHQPTTPHYFRSLRRSFFSFPSFPSLPNAAPQTYREQKILHYKQHELFEVVANVSSYPQFVPFCTGSRILGTVVRNDSKPYSMEAELTVGFLSFNESYVSRVTCTPFTSVEAVASSSTPLFKSLTTTWSFKPMSPQTAPQVNQRGQDNSGVIQHRPPESTLVSLDLSFAFENPIHAAVSSAFFGQVSKQMVNAFEERCLEVYGRDRA